MLTSKRIFEDVAFAILLLAKRSRLFQEVRSFTVRIQYEKIGSPDC
jgi:hypothetical protein